LIQTALQKYEPLDATQGITLIELLFVVTTIVVLLALLAPALNRAICQTERAGGGAPRRASVRVDPRMARTGESSGWTEGWNAEQYTRLPAK